ncbi:MAG: hypothetical protein EU529_05850 [Promethearchaeota archaeon]|nr:MAG: hypothetical protein EU529_05850 [Candidatus Lokiarchaeota archaeon]
MSKLVNSVYNEEGFWDVYPKISKSLQDMRDKIIGVTGIKWEWHVVLTYNTESLNEMLRKGGASGKELEGFLRDTKTIYNKGRKYFWKYEEGTKNQRSHFHLLFEFKKKFNKEYIAKKMFRKGWEAGKVDIIKMIKKARTHYMNYKKSDVEIMMGYLLYRKWGKGIVYARELKGLGSQHKRNLIYYVNKDLLKPTKLGKIKSSGKKWNFGRGYQFVVKPMFKKSDMVKYNQCISKLLLTKQNFIEYYDSFGENGYRKLFRKIKNIKKGMYDKVIY